MENTEEIFQSLDDFAKRKPKSIPRELEEYLAYVARTGDPVYQWGLVKCLFKEKLLTVITDFYETTPGLDIPHCPNVDPFDYDTMKNSLLERIDSFSSAPFTVQRICELLTTPRKQYNRIDKFMRAIEKNVLVVSTREPGPQRHVEQENGEQIEPMVNGSDNNSDYNVDVEMEDVTWKENLAARQNMQPQPSSSEGLISVDNIESRLQAKEDPAEPKDKVAAQYESVTPPELNISPEENVPQITEEENNQSSMEEEKEKTESMNVTDDTSSMQEKTDPTASVSMTIPEIRIEDAEMTEQKLIEKANEETPRNENIISESNTHVTEKNNDDLNVIDNKSQQQNSNCIEENVTPQTVDDPNVEIDVNDKETNETKLISDVITSSEESSSSSDNTDCNSNSPKLSDSDAHIDTQEESNQSDVTSEEETKMQTECPAEETSNNLVDVSGDKVDVSPQLTLQNDAYSISDVNSEISKKSPDNIVETEADVTTKENNPELPKDDNVLTEDAKESS